MAEEKIDLGSGESPILTTVNLFTTDLYPVLLPKIHEDGTGMLKVPANLVRDYQTALREVERHQEALLEWLRRSGQPVPFPFEGYQPIEISSDVAIGIEAYVAVVNDEGGPPTELPQNGTNIPRQVAVEDSQNSSQTEVEDEQLVAATRPVRRNSRRRS